MPDGMTSLGLVALGGGIGALLRYLLTIAALKALRIELWVGIMVVNVLGCFLIAVCAASLVLADGSPGPFAHWLAHALGVSAEAAMARGHLLFMTGLLGGFTTFSTAMLDVYVLWLLKGRALAMLNLFLTPLLGLLAVVVGFKFGGGL
ncbi:MAG: CrcB family protein [Phycisphaerales bacterium]|nr:CrcB family protein [Phycisphaerales bacterium]